MTMRRDWRLLSASRQPDRLVGARGWVETHRPALTEVRTWLVAVIVALSVANPGLFNRYGLILSLVVAGLAEWRGVRAVMVVLATAALTAWQVVSLAWAENPAAGTFVVTATKTAVMFLILRLAVRGARQLQIVASAFVVAAVFAVLRLTVEGYAYAAFSTIRYTLEGLNANYLGYSLTAALGVVVLVWTATTSRAAHRLLAAGAVVILVGAWLTGTRGATLGAVALIIWLGACRLASRPPFRALLAAAAVAAVAISSGAIDTALRSVDVGGRSTGDLSGRLVLWPAAREVWADSPVVGEGPKAMRLMAPLHMDAHSVFLEVLSSLGVIGIILFCWFMWAVLLRDTRALESPRRALLLGAFLCATGPAYLTGSWEATPAAWMVLLLFGRIAVLGGVAESGREQSAGAHRAVRASKWSRGAA